MDAVIARDLLTLLHLIFSQCLFMFFPVFEEVSCQLCQAARLLAAGARLSKAQFLGKRSIQGLDKFLVCSSLRISPLREKKITRYSDPETAEREREQKHTCLLVINAFAQAKDASAAGSADGSSQHGSTKADELHLICELGFSLKS